MNKDVKQKYDILDYTELPIGSVIKNPDNPRPTFQLDDDDPELLAMADSIKTEGQTQPVAVYELIGHYSYPDQPGVFMLLQGERRWRSCHIGGIELIRANVHRTPGNRAEELELLSIEDAHKLPWQPFFEMQHAWVLANEYGLSVRHPNIAAKTGLTMDQLRTAEKIFSLTPPVQALVAQYEQEMYTQRLAGRRKKGSRITGAKGIRVMEFTPAKAALVYEIFVALRQNMTLTVKEFDDADLQQRIASWATNGATIEDLVNLHQALRQVGVEPPPGMIAKVHNLVQNPDIGVQTMVRTMGNSHLQRLTNAAKRIEKCGKDAENLARRADHFGHDPTVLAAVRTQLIAAQRNFDRLERVVTDRIKMLEKH